MSAKHLSFSKKCLKPSLSWTGAGKLVQSSLNRELWDVRKKAEGRGREKQTLWPLLWEGMQGLCYARSAPKCGQWSCPFLVPNKRLVKVGFPDRLLLLSRPHPRNSFLIHLGLEEMGGGASAGHSRGVGCLSNIRDEIKAWGGDHPLLIFSGKGWREYLDLGSN